METIRSHDNSKIKHIKKLLDDKKYREEHGEYVVEGKRWVIDALAPSINCPASNVLGLFIRESSVEGFAEFIKFAENKIGAENVFAVADNVFDKVADTGHSQGVLAILGFKGRLLSWEGSALYLDRIRDPGNLGTIIRTAVATGFNHIYLDNCADVYSPKVVRSTMGALLKADICKPLETTIEVLNFRGYQIFAADMNGENIFTLSEKPEKICLIIGSEADGIRPELLKLADKIVSIPMQNTESLNAAVAAGILMYQLKTNNE